MRDDHVLCEAAKEFDKIWNSIVPDWLTRLSIQPDQPLRSNEASFGDNEIKIPQQPMIFCVDADHVRTVEDLFLRLRAIALALRVLRLRAIALALRALRLRAIVPVLGASRMAVVIDHRVLAFARRTQFGIRNSNRCGQRDSQGAFLNAFGLHF